jgi:mannose-6-phosphate isomerase-like protein (cupin superfamily)
MDMPIGTQLGATLLEQKGHYAYPCEVHGGNGPVNIQSYFLDKSELPVMMQFWEVPVGGGEGMHRHPREKENLEEIYLVVEGKARIRVNGDDHFLSPGDAVLTTPEDDHDVSNCGDSMLRLVVLWGQTTASRPDYRNFNSIRTAYAFRAKQDA